MADTTAQTQLIEALLAVQRELPAISKAHTAKVQSKKGDKASYTYKYANLTDALAVLRDPLANNGLALIQTFEVDDHKNTVLVTTLYHVGGGHLSSRCPIGTYPNPQDTGKAITYYRRYSIMALLCIATEDDDAQKVAQVVPQSEDDKKKLAFQNAAVPLLEELLFLSPVRAKEFLHPYNGSLTNVKSDQRQTAFKALEAQLQLAVDADGLTEEDMTTPGNDPQGEIARQD